MAGRFEGLTDEQWKMIDPLINLLAQVKIFGSNRRRPRSCPDELQTDKGYDAKELRDNLRPSITNL